MEEIMQYIWQWRLYGNPDKHLTDGRPLRILHPGLLNTASGPDFFNARVRIDSTEWAGNVELHLKASDWYRHGHDSDTAYDSVILHVVGHSDTHLCRTDGTPIPQLLLPFSEKTAELYSTLHQGASPLRCSRWLPDMSRLHMSDWLQSAGMERLQQKADRLDEYLKYTCGDWAQATFIALARALGFGLNSEPFERLARALPLSVMARHSDSLFQLEALLLGYAGLLSTDSPMHDNYYDRLRDEYAFLAHKYQLKTLPSDIWRMKGVRPQNMPYRKLALLAHLCVGVSTIFSRIIDINANIDRLTELFDVEFEGYWEHHLTFGAESSRSYKKALSLDMVRVLLINVAAPIYYAYGRYSGRFELEEAAVDLWCKLPCERNAVMKLWAETAGVHPRSAFESQALLHIYRSYCERHECLRCRAGHALMRVSAKSATS